MKMNILELDGSTLYIAYCSRTHIQNGNLTSFFFVSCWWRWETNERQHDWIISTWWHFQMSKQNCTLHTYTKNNERNEMIEHKLEQSGPTNGWQRRDWGVGWCCTLFICDLPFVEIYEYDFIFFLFTQFTIHSRRFLLFLIIRTNHSGFVQKLMSFILSKATFIGIIYFSIICVRRCVICALLYSCAGCCKPVANSFRFAFISLFGGCWFSFFEFD